MSQRGRRGANKAAGNIGGSATTGLPETLPESAWLLALALTPSYLNPFTLTAFEPDKALLVRVLAAVAGFAVALGAGSRGREPVIVAGSRRALAGAVAGLIGAAALATIFSIAPSTSWWGSYERRQGLLTLLAYVVLAATMALRLRRRAQIRRVLGAILIGSAPPSLYALAQCWGLDPVAWPPAAVERVSSTAGNPIFLAAYLVMVIPFTLAALLDTTGILRPAVRSGRWRLSSLAVGLLLAAQVSALICTRSRGPLLGLGAAVGVFALLLALRAGRARLGLAAATTIAALFALGIGATYTIGGAAPWSRALRVFDFDRGSGRIRLLIWEGLVELAARAPARLATGHGPETLLWAYPPVHSAALTRAQDRFRAPDRSHNAQLDALVTTGVGGLVAGLAVLLLALRCGLESLGLIRGMLGGRRYWRLVLLGSAAGAIIPAAIDGAARLLALGLGVGLLVGLITFLIALAIDRRGDRPRDVEDTSLVIIACLAALAGHFAEIQVGIAVTATQMLAWIAVGLLLAAGRDLSGSDEDQIGNQARPARVKRAAESRPAGDQTRATLVTCAVLLALLVFVSAGLLRRGLPMNAELTSWIAALPWAIVLAGIAALSWSLGGRRSSSAPGRRRFLLALGCAALLWIWVVSLAATRADAFARLGRDHELWRAWDRAIPLYRRALELWPREDRYRFHLGHVLIQQAAVLSTPPPRAHELLTTAAAILAQARDHQPLEVDHARALALLHRIWSERASSAGEALEQQALAVAAYRATTRLAPTRVELWTDWAGYLLGRGLPAAALAPLRQALALDPHHPTALLLMEKMGTGTNFPSQQ